MSLRRDERGFVLITAMIVLSVFMVLTVAIVTIVDVQTNQTGHERSGEAAFNLAQSALQTEAYQLQVNWPATATQALPTTCNQATSQETGCEGAALTQEVQTPTPGPDYAHATWSAQALDNTGAGYSPSMVGTAPAWDSNGDNTMWVRAQATANGQTRTVIEQVTRKLQTDTLPENAVTAGGLYTQSNGQPVIINATDPNSGVTGPVTVRCTAAGPPPQGNCIGWQSGQLVPASAYQTGYTSSSSLTPTEIASMIQEAQAAHTLYNIGSTPVSGAITGCPVDGSTYNPPPGGTYPVVVVEGAGTCPSSTSTYKRDWFSPSDPGVVVFLQGSIALGGSQNQSTFYGLLFMLNQGGSTPAPGFACSATQISNAPTLVTLSGGALIDGAVFVDGCGLVGIQDNGDALNFSSSAFRALQTYGSATPVPGTFRVVSQ